MAWNRTDSPDSTPATPSTSGRKSDGRVSTLGASISIRGDLSGSEDLRIEGAIEGTVKLPKYRVVVADSGRIKADIHSRSICVEGEVKGNLNGEEEVIIRPSGKLEGNITAPSVTLENGAKFRGSIDMEPTRRAREAADNAAAEAAKQSPGKGTSDSKPARDPQGALPAAATAAAKS